ncbi:src kinase-associated phosphoprotein 1 isoform X2 [Bufo gargarizans]|uniref:src kinase-associated phosphoprotein 1 isoform X2 n=1 Tax=Bufo gargarizans TaxID=30331 RepID=UPI001CF494C9|nr:src kinase-associated phosphoprotein 1 isoform X2 [Bufo gargarizans]
MTQRTDIPRDVVILLREAESFLSTCLQHETVSSKARELGEEILLDFRTLRSRYPLYFQLSDDDADTEGQDNYDDNGSLSHGTASDEVSLPFHYLDEESRDAEEPEKILKQGFLEKRNRDHGFFGSEWQKRWCVLTNISFCYYSSGKGKVPKGGFLIKDCGAQLVSSIRKDSRRDSCFELVSPGNRSYEFTAASPGDARDWVEHIQFLVKDILSPTIPYEDDEESYDDVDSLNSSHMIRPSPLNRANSPTEDDDIYEVVPDLHETTENGCWGGSYIVRDEDEENRDQSTLTGESVIKYADYYQGLWNCKSDKSDELSFQRGDLIRILSKEYNAYGWWVGELDGMIGIVPKEYLQAAYDLR